MSITFEGRSDELKPDEQATLLMLRHLDPEIARAYDLVRQFAHMLRTRTADQLDGWLEQATTSKIGELQSFVQGSERDKVAVRTGLTVQTNNGVVEGKVNQLKLIKRMMFGRAKFPLTLVSEFCMLSKIKGRRYESET